MLLNRDNIDRIDWIGLDLRQDDYLGGILLTKKDREGLLMMIKLIQVQQCLENLCTKLVEE